MMANFFLKSIVLMSTWCTSNPQCISEHMMWFSFEIQKNLQQENFIEKIVILTDLVKVWNFLTLIP